MTKKKEEGIELAGTVVETLRSSRFRVQLENGHLVLAHLGGRLRQHFIKIVSGDKVTVRISPYNLSMGIIVYRH